MTIHRQADAVHKRLYRERGKASDYPCAECAAPALDWSYDHADPEERSDNGRLYSLDLGHYRPLCRTCHTALDRQKEIEQLAREVC